MLVSFLLLMLISRSWIRLPKIRYLGRSILLCIGKRHSSGYYFSEGNGWKWLKKSISGRHGNEQFPIPRGFLFFSLKHHSNRGLEKKTRKMTRHQELTSSWPWDSTLKILMSPVSTLAYRQGHIMRALRRAGADALMFWAPNINLHFRRSCTVGEVVEGFTWWDRLQYQPRWPDGHEVTKKKWCYCIRSQFLSYFSCLKKTEHLMADG